MKLSTKVAYNTIIQFAGKIISTVLGLMSIAIVTRYLGQIGFGQYTTVITFLSVFAILADFGMTLVTTQMISRPGVDEKKILNNIFSLRLVSALIFISLAPIAVIFFPYDQIIKTGVLIASISFVFTALNQVFVGIFQKNLRMDKVALAEIISRLALVVFVILAVRNNYGLMGVIYAVVIAGFINSILLYISARKFHPVKFAFDLSLWREIFKLSWPLAITIALNLVYLKADTLILSIVKSQAEVGIYGAAYRVIDVLITLPFMFVGIVLPIMTVSWLNKDRETYNKALQRSFDFMAICVMPFLVGAQFFGEEVMSLVAGRSFAASGEVLKILILATGFIFLGTVFSHAIIAMNKQKKIIGAYIFTSITALVGYLIFIPRYSYFGAAWVTIYSEAAIALAAMYYVWKYSEFIPNLRNMFKSAMAASIMALFIYALPITSYDNNWKLILTLLASGSVYFISLYLFRGITKEDLLSLLNR